MVVIDFVMAYSSLLREKTLRLRDLTLTATLYLEIYFFEVNTNYNLSSVLKTSEFSRVHSTSDNFDVFTHEMKYFWYLLPKKVNFLFILYLL